MRFSLQQAVLLFALVCALSAWCYDHHKLKSRTLVNAIEFRRDLVLGLQSSDFELLPKWESSEDEPPVSAAQARGIAEKLIEEIGELESGHEFLDLRLHSMRLIPLRGKLDNDSGQYWCYVVDIVGTTEMQRKMAQLIRKKRNISSRVHPTEVCRAVVLMDGSLHISPPSSKDTFVNNLHDSLLDVYPVLSPAPPDYIVAALDERAEEKENEIVPGFDGKDTTRRARRTQLENMVKSRLAGKAGAKANANATKTEAQGKKEDVETKLLEAFKDAGTDQKTEREFILSPSSK